MLVDVNSHEIELRRKLASNEIIDIITNTSGKKAIITSLNSKLIVWDFSQKLKFDEDSNIHTIELLSPANSICLDETASEGLLGLIDGGIYYANIEKSLFTKLIGTPVSSVIINKVKAINEDIFATIHSNGSFKLWNADTAEELTEFTFEKCLCTEVSYIKESNQVVAFFNDSSFKLIEVNDFSKVNTYTLDEFIISSDEEQKYIVGCDRIEENQSTYYFLTTNKGEIYYSDFNNLEDEITLIEVIIIIELMKIIIG